MALCRACSATSASIEIGPSDSFREPCATIVFSDIREWTGVLAKRSVPASVSSNVHATPQAQTRKAGSGMRAGRGSGRARRERSTCCQKPGRAGGEEAFRSASRVASRASYSPRQEEHVFRCSRRRMAVHAPSVPSIYSESLSTQCEHSSMACTNSLTGKNRNQRVSRIGMTPRSFSLSSILARCRRERTVPTGHPAIRLTSS